MVQGCQGSRRLPEAYYLKSNRWLSACLGAPEAMQRGPHTLRRRLPWPEATRQLPAYRLCSCGAGTGARQARGAGTGSWRAGRLSTASGLRRPACMRCRLVRRPVDGGSAAGGRQYLGGHDGVGLVCVCQPLDLLPAVQADRNGLAAAARLRQYIALGVARRAMAPRAPGILGQQLECADVCGLSATPM